MVHYKQWPRLWNKNNPMSTIGILQRKNRDPYQLLLLHTHLVSWKTTSSRHRPNVSYNLAAFHLAQPTHTSWKLCEPLQHLPTLQGTKKEVWTHTYPRETTNCEPMALNCSWHHWTMDHSAVATFFKIKRAYNTSSTYNHRSEHALHGNCGMKKQGKHHRCLLSWPSLALLLPHPSWLFPWQWDRIHFCQISRTSSIIWNSIQVDHCQKPSSQQYPQLHPSSYWKSPTFQLPHYSRPQHHICPTRTSHATYVGDPHNIPYNLKGKPSLTCIQLQHDSSNFLCHQLVCHQQSQTSSIAIRCWHQNCQCIPHEFCINNKVLIRRDIGNPYLDKLTKPTQGPFKIIDVQQLPINCTILIQQSLTSVECINICWLLPFLNVTIEDANVIPQSLWIVTWLLEMKGLNQLLYHTK